MLLRRVPRGALIYWDDSDSDSVVDAGEIWNCTATVTAAENRSVLMTAGHCVVKSANQTPNGKPRWHKSMAFVPSYAVRSFYRALESNDDALTQSVRKSMWFAQPIPGTDYSTARFSVTLDRQAILVTRLRCRRRRAAKPGRIDSDDFRTFSALRDGT